MCICVEDTRFSVFVCDETLFVVKGDNIPPIVCKKEMSNPEFDIIKTICKIIEGL